VSTVSQLQAERRLLDEARTGLVAGDPDLALKRLEQHQHRFLNPLLAEERDAMWVEALAQAGRQDEARQRAAAFRRTYPQSLFLPTIDSAAGGNNP
jgi:outer membrane protein assembly factor BamD (BamD/ComL family)